MRRIPARRVRIICVLRFAQGVAVSEPGDMSSDSEFRPSAADVATAASPPQAAERSVFVYALGQVEPRFPSLAIEKEFAQSIGSADAAGLTDRQATRNALQHPAATSNLGRSAGQRGLGAPGNVVMSHADGKPMLQSGTSFAAARVTGAIALLWSLFPSASASSIRLALRTDRGRSVTPPLMDVRAAYQRLQDGLAAHSSYGQFVPRT